MTTKPGMRFERGDLIRVTDKETGKELAQGAAMETRGNTGYSEFHVLENGHTIPYNLNAVSVELLFSAEVARNNPLPKIDEEVAAAGIIGRMWGVIDDKATIGDIRATAKDVVQDFLAYLEAKRMGS